MYIHMYTMELIVGSTHYNVLHMYTMELIVGGIYYNVLITHVHNGVDCVVMYYTCTQYTIVYIE